MYRNVSYFYDEQKKGGIRLYTWDECGNPVIREVPHQSYCTYQVQYDSGKKSIFGTDVERKYFVNKKQRDQFVENNPGLKILEAFKPEIEFLRSEYFDSYEKPDFAKFKLRTHYLDIEIATGVSMKYSMNHRIKIRKKP